MPPHTILRPKPPDAANKRELHTCLHNYRYICGGTIIRGTIMQRRYNAATQVFCPISLRRCKRTNQIPLYALVTQVFAQIFLRRCEKTVQNLASLHFR